MVHTASFQRFLRILGPFLEKDRNPKTLVLEKNFRPKKVMTFCKKNFFWLDPPPKTPRVFKGFSILGFKGLKMDQKKGSLITN